MIVFDLRCSAGHVFEAWFASTAAWETQRGAGQVTCPLCGDGDIDKALMAPNVSSKGNRAGNAAVDPAAIKTALSALAAKQAEVLEGSEWVGPAFATRARAMHAGDESDARIHGHATLAEAKALAEEGVPVAPLPLPVIPPERAN